MSSFPNFISFVFLLFLSSLALAATEYPITITDGMGNELTIKQKPQSVSSKTLFTDEVLLSMIEPERLSSLTDHATDQRYSTIVDKVPNNIPLLDLNVERILSRYPDIVFAANWSDTGKVEQLIQAGITVYLIKTPTTVKAIQAEIKKIGFILDIEPQADAVIKEMQNKLESDQTKVDAIRAKNWVTLDYNSWGTSSGVNTTWNTVLEHAGLLNGSAPYEQGAFGMVTMSKELIVEVNPDILFIPGWAADEESAASSFYQQAIHDPALSQIKAIQTGRVFVIPSHLKGTYSQYIIDTITLVIHSVYKTI